jgi:hypothetical protein
MTKKEKKNVVDNAAKQAEQRLAAIREFNVNNMGESWIDPNRVPTEEEINAAKEEFENHTRALQEKNDYLVADAPNALRVAKFLKNFISNGFWAQRYFVGVLNFVEKIDEFIAECEKEPKDLVLEYPPLQFCMLMLENYAGFGIESAKKMAELWDEYVPIYDTIRDHIEWYNKEAKMCERLKQRWGMLAQGYYLVFTDVESDAVAAEEPAENTENNEKGE